MKMSFFDDIVSQHPKAIPPERAPEINVQRGTENFNLLRRHVWLILRQLAS